jgi:hypothetical protein
VRSDACRRGAFCQRRWDLVILIVLGLVLVSGSAAVAQDQFTLLVTGASGGAGYATRYDEWRSTLVAALRNRPGFDDQSLEVLAETPGPGVGRASRDGVQQAIGRLVERMDADDVLYIVMMGHGSFDGIDAKFNLVGPDVEAREWNAWLDQVPGRVVVVNTTSVSSPFIERLSGRRRTIVTGYDTVFPEFFVAAYEDRAGDADKNGLVSILEAFDYASQGVRRWYQERGRLATERALLEDSGDGRGREAGESGRDGLRAASQFLGAGPVRTDAVADPSLAPLLTRRQELIDSVQELRAAKEQMNADLYLRELERILLELAQLSRRLNRGSS